MRGRRTDKLHTADLAIGAGSVAPSWRLSRKFPNAIEVVARAMGLPATRHYQDHSTGELHGHHLHPKSTAASPPRRPPLLGHRDVGTTMIYTHVVNRGPFGVRSPLD